VDSQLIRRALALLLAPLVAACASSPPRGSAAATTTIALVGGRVQPDPNSTVIENGIVLTDGGTITAVGARSAVSVPTGARVLDCAGATVLPGFWNSHVHFTRAAFRGAASAPPAQLTAALSAMLTSRGVVHAVDTGSYLRDTLALRSRIETGEIAGPSILTAGSSLAPAGGSPYYILPARLPEAASAEDAAAIVERELDDGSDVVKLFTGSWARRDAIVVMPLDVVRAAVAVAHRRGKLVIAHPSNSAGARAAIEGGVDILAHTFPSELDGRPWDRSLPPLMRERGMSLIPTLKLFRYELTRAGAPPELIDRVTGNARAQLRSFAQLGGQVLFGTDVGYMTDDDPTDEYVAMQDAGLGYRAIVAALTTAPAARFGAAQRTGRLATRTAADVVVVDGRPEDDIRALARVRLVLRDGRVIYERAR
jgi:imidazolonepropionase-like amidohydrolase